MNIIGLDIGSMYAKAVLCQIDINKKITVLKAAAFPYRTKACKCGSLITLEAAKEAVDQVLSSIKEGFVEPIDSYQVNVSGTGVSSYNGTAKIPLWKKEGDDRRVKVTKNHVQEVVESAKMSYALEKDRVLHTFAQEFQVDEQQPTKNPISMTGVKMKASVYVIKAEKNHLENIDTVLRDCGIKNYNLIYSPIATAEAVIDAEDKDNGVIVVSVGAETTELTIYHDGILRLAKVILPGSDYVTRDLKTILQIDYRLAEEIKLNKVNVFLPDVDEEEAVDEVLDKKNKPVKLAYISEIANSRMMEIYEEVVKEIFKGSYQKKIHSSVVLTGSGIAFKGTEKLFRDYSKASSKFGKLVDVEWLDEKENSMYYTAVGLVKYAVQNSIAQHKEEIESFDEEIEDSLWTRFKNFLSDLF